MNERNAITATLELGGILYQEGKWHDSDIPEMGYQHFVWMSVKVETTPSMSKTKLCRWLGWMQAVLVTNCYPAVTLETVKRLNMVCSDKGKK